VTQKFCPRAGCHFSGSPTELAEHTAARPHRLYLGLTLTTWTLEKGERYLRGTYEFLVGTRAESSVWDGAELKSHTFTYAVGMFVQVHSYGAWRPGRVTDLGRTLVEVDYARNRTGKRHVKRFSAENIRPREVKQ